MKKIILAAALAASTTAASAQTEVIIERVPVQLPESTDAAIAFGGCSAGLGAFAAAAGATFPIGVPVAAVAILLCTVVVGQELTAQ